MAGARKLATEIDRTLKTVAERVEIFNDYYERVQSANTAAQKEKYEGDLKKEIKKLQRLRDQIKTWLASSDVKSQRTVLMENRKLIEEKMEKFKVVERDAKTKAFSKEGLAAASKMDPRDKERNDVRDWVNECIDSLSQQIESIEAEIESMESQSSKKKKNKGNDEKEEEQRYRIERHNFHILKFETLIKLLDSGEYDDLDRQIKETLEDDIRYYIDENEDEDFAENDYMYDDFEDMMAGGGEVQGIKLPTKEDDAAAKVAADALDAKRQTAIKEKTEAEKKAAETKAAEMKRKQEVQKAAAEKAAAAAAASASKAAAAAAAAKSNQGLVAMGGKVGKEVPPKAPIATINFAAAASSAAAAAAPKVPPSAPTTGSVSPGNTGNGSWSSPPGGQQGVPGGGYPNRGGPGSGGPPSGTVPGRPPVQAAPPTMPGAGVRPPQPPGVMAAGMPAAGPSPGPPSGQGGPNPVPGGLGDVPPAGSLARSLQLLSTAALLLPEQQEQTRSYTPLNPHPAPSCYPDQPPAHFNQASFFATMDTDTLLFVFYYQQGTYQQYLAARELKKQAWRFHKKYLTWFQRHEEPKIITDEYEQGTYVYFDFEAGWCQRKKTDFTFEYRFLEDHDLP